MAKSKEVLINVTVQATDGINTLNQVNKSLENGAKAASDMGSAVNQALQPIKGSVADLQSQVNALEKARSATATTSAEYKKQGIAIDELNIKIAKLSGAKGLGSVNSAAGIAGATVNEFGRFVSDLPFGIVAVTNNLSQMGSLFGILVGQASQMNNGLSTTKNVIALLRAQFMGPVGILFLFQVAVSAITMFAKSSKAADDTLKGLSSTLKEQTTILRSQLDVFNDGTKTLEERANALRIIESIDKDLARTLSKSNITDEEKNKLSKDYNRLIDLRIKSEQESEKLAETQILNKAKISDLDAEINRQTKLLNGFTDDQIQNDENLFRVQASIIDKQAERNRLQIQYNESAEQQEALTLELITLEDQFGNSIEATTKKLDALREARERLLQSRISLISAQEGGSVQDQQERLEEILDLEKQQLKSQEEIDREKALEAGLSAEELLDITEAYQNEREILEIGHFKALMDIRKDFNKELILEEKTGNDFIVGETVMSFKDMRDQIVGTYSQTETAWRIHHIKISETLREALERRRKIQENGDKITQQLEDEKFERQIMSIQVAQELANSLFDVANAGFDKELILEQNKTVELNNQLKERLRNESLSAEERKSIQNQIAQNDEALRKKQEAIEEKRFKLNKAASIANAVVNTYLAAATALKNFGGVPTGIPAMVATIATGLAQVAVIAKQKFVKSDAGGSPGISTSTASTPMAIQAPSFNVVGQSGATQLADVVSGQLNRPVKTYVVAKDVTTAQELDRNRVSAASI